MTAKVSMSAYTVNLSHHVLGAAIAKWRNNNHTEIRNVDRPIFAPMRYGGSAGLALPQGAGLRASRRRPKHGCRGDGCL